MILRTDGHSNLYTNTSCFTFLGEKILGIFAGHYEFAWDTPQQLNDQCYMVYTAEGCKRRGEDRQDKRQIHQTVSQSQAQLWVCGWRAEEEERGQADSTHGPDCCRGRGTQTSG